MTGSKTSFLALLNLDSGAVLHFAKNDGRKDYPNSRPKDTCRDSEQTNTNITSATSEQTFWLSVTQYKLQSLDLKSRTSPALLP